MEESEALGLDELDIFDEDEEEDEEEEEVFKKVTLKELPPELAELSPEQKDEIEAGGVINLSSAEEQAPPAAEQPHGHRGRHKAEAAQAGAKTEGFKDLTPKAGGAAPGAVPTSPAPVSQGAPLPSFDDDEETDNDAPVKKKKEKVKKEKKPKKAKDTEPALYEVDENGNPVKGKRPKKEKVKKEKTKSGGGKGKSSPLGAFIAAVIALAVGLGGGYFGKMFFFPDLPTPECQTFAQKAVDTVAERLSEGQELYITEAYVKDGAVSSQCIFRAIIESGDGISSSWYRVKIDHDNTNPGVSRDRKSVV